jgi:hypothetical protein
MPKIYLLEYAMITSLEIKYLRSKIITLFIFKVCISLKELFRILKNNKSPFFIETIITSSYSI